MDNQPTSFLPRVAVSPHERVAGIASRDDLESGRVGLLDVLDFEEAFFSPHDTDAHFITYQAWENDKPLEAWPRCNKASLPLLSQAGTHLMATMIVLDFDTHYHTPWDRPEAAREAFERDIEPLSGLLGQWTVCYATRAGLRLVFVLDQPTLVSQAEAYSRWLTQQAARQGGDFVAVDEATTDWTRLFRLPDVLRDGRQQGDCDWYFIEFQSENRISTEELKQIVSRTTSQTHQQAIEVAVERFSGQMPDPETCRTILETVSASGKPTKTQFYRLARNVLRDKECFAALFEGQTIAAPGERNKTLTRLVGQAVGMLFGHEGVTPAHIFALFYLPVLSLEPDETSRWDVVAWDMICRFWGLEDAKTRTKIARQHKAERHARTLEETILEGMGQWCHDPDFDPTPRKGETAEDARDRQESFIERRLILSSKSDYYVMTPTGYYDSVPVSSAHLIPRIRELGMGSVIQTDEMTEKRVQNRKSVDLVNQYVKVVTRTEGFPELPGTILEGDIAKVCLYRRNPRLEPQYDRRVDQWLRVLFGPYFDKASAWLGHALAWEEGPICALSLIGAGGCGKKMLAMGLAECLEVPAIADARELVDDTQYGLASSPFLVVNEGWPKDRTGRPIDRFRQVVGGDPIVIRRKWRDDLVARSPLRVMMFANNTNVVDGLIQGQFMSVADREAVGIRILHMRVGSAASDWLREKGGVAFTQGWVAGDAGKKSDYVLARHLLWLYANRPPKDNRLLVEGNGMTELMLEMSSQSGHSPVIYECLIRMVEAKVRPRTKWGSGFLITNDHHVYTCPSSVLEFYRMSCKDAWAEGQGKLSIKGVADVLASLEADQDRMDDVHGRQPWAIKGYEDYGRKKWVDLALMPLLMVAEKYGWECEKLRDLLDKQRKKGYDPQ